MNFWFILTRLTLPILCQKSKSNKYYVFTSKPVVIEYDGDCENVLLTKDDAGNITYSVHDPEMDTWLEKETIPINGNVYHQDYTYSNRQRENVTPVPNKSQTIQNPINKGNLNQNGWEVVDVADENTSAEITGPGRSNVIDSGAQGEAKKDADNEKGKDSKGEKRKGKDGSKSKSKKKKSSKKEEDGVRDCISMTSLVALLMCMILI